MKDCLISTIIHLYIIYLFVFVLQFMKIKLRIYEEKILKVMRDCIVT